MAKNNWFSADILEKTLEFKEGYQAFWNSVSPDDCPYDMPYFIRVLAWQLGYAKAENEDLQDDHKSESPL